MQPTFTTDELLFIHYSLFIANSKANLSDVEYELAASIKRKLDNILLASGK